MNVNEDVWDQADHNRVSGIESLVGKFGGV